MPAPLNHKLEYATRQRFDRVRSVAGEGGGDASGIFQDLLRTDKNREERISHGF